jgi:hypothetical protein
MALKDLIRPAPTLAAERPPGITCTRGQIVESNFAEHHWFGRIRSGRIRDARESVPLKSCSLKSLTILVAQP